MMCNMIIVVLLSNKPGAGNRGSSMGSNAKSNTNINTGDQSNQKGLLALLGMSFMAISSILIKKNKKEITK